MRGENRPGMLFLCEDVIFEILSRLSHKLLCRFKSVSKDWYILISSNNFMRCYYYSRMKKQRRRRTATTTATTVGTDPTVLSGIFAQHSSDTEHPPKFLPLYYEYGDVPDDPSLTFLFLRGEVGYIKLLFSCKGLLLCRKIVQWDDSGPNIRWSYHVCNPVTKQQMKLPPSPNHSYHSYWEELQGLDFDPISSGFHFKVARILAVENDTVLIEFFTSETGVWREYKMVVSSPAYEWLTSNIGNILFMNNAIFWLSNAHGSLIMYHLEEKYYKAIKLPETYVCSRKAFWKNDGQLLNDHESLIMYHLDEEYYKAIKFPETYVCSKKAFWKNDGHIYYYQSDYTGIQMWVLLIDVFKVFKWELRHSINNEALIGNNLDVARTTLFHRPRNPCKYKFEAFAYDFNLRLLFLHFNDTVVSYDLETGKLEVIKTIKFEEWMFFELPYQHSWALFYTSPYI